ncbi:hypothetical protein TSUD_04990 [Trifolium subterraneum]|uniref:BI1-like protein n=1 Tax=Trifolium subterraneum TaxID=3900 RepID=A0A2Z6PAF5_TRISU|nr:hypothetical protein TSUD_04990 [Trifolium subterraneum]
MLGNVNTGGENGLYPISTLELRWSFIRKIYSISIFQLLLTIAVISVVLFVPPVANFFNSTHGTGVYIVLIFVPLIASGLPEFYYYKKHPHDYFFLLFLNVSSALPVGLTWVFAGGN